MKCSFCGNELESGATFCPECGTILGIDETDIKTEIKYSEPVDVYSNSQPEKDDEIEVPEYVPAEVNEEPVSETVESEDDDDDPFKEMHPDTVPVEKKKKKSLSKREKKNKASDEDDDAYYEEDASEYYYEDDPDYYEDFDEDIDEDFDDDMGYLKDDMLKRKKKKDILTIAILAVILGAFISAGAIYLNRNPMLKPVVSPDASSAPISNVVDPIDEKDTSESETEEDTSEEEPTDEESTEEKSTEEKTTEEKTTEEKTTEEKTSAEKTTEEKTTEKVTTAAPTTTQPTTVPTTAPTTTAPTTAPTTVPSTTKPSTAAPTTAAPVNQLKKPDKTISKFTVYATEDGVSLRYTPNAASSRILYLSVGADLVVTGEENGFYYVYSSRYGVYGWVNKAYTASTRPVAKTEQQVSGVVAPDTKGSGKTMYVNTADGLRLRKGPGTDYGVIRMISNGYPVVVKGTSSKVSGWVYVTDTTHGVSGWVSAAYLK